jgi:hypothetical protein
LTAIDERLVERITGFLPGGLDLTLPDAFFDFADVLVLGLEGSAR